MAKNTPKNTEIVIRFDAVTALIAGLMILLAIIAIIVLFTYLTPKLGTTSRPTSPAQTVQPTNAPLLLPTAVMPQDTDTPFPRNLIPPETVSAIQTGLAEQAANPQPSSTPAPVLATVQSENSNKELSPNEANAAVSQKIQAEYANVVEKNKCLRSEIASTDGDIYFCPGAAYSGGLPDSCVLCNGQKDCPHAGKYYYCIYSRKEFSE